MCRSVIVHRRFPPTKPYGILELLEILYLQRSGEEDERGEKEWAKSDNDQRAACPSSLPRLEKFGLRSRSCVLSPVFPMGLRQTTRGGKRGGERLQRGHRGVSRIGRVNSSQTKQRREPASLLELKLRVSSQLELTVGNFPSGRKPTFYCKKALHTLMLYSQLEATNAAFGLSPNNPCS